MLVAATAASTARNDEAFIGTGEVVDELASVSVEEHSANGNFEDSVFASRPVQLEPMPCSPRSALCSGLKRK